MKEILVKLYGFDELEEDAKEKARSWWREVSDFAWGDESRASIYAFTNHFNILLKDWSVDSCTYNYYAQATNANFRGMKLADFKRDHTPTGYILDCYLWETFYDTFKATGDAKQAFYDALDAGFKAWRDDMAWQLSDEAVDEALIINQYEFMGNGKHATF